MTEVIIIRHGECLADKADPDNYPDWPLLKGRSDTDYTRLSRKGILETIETGRRFREFYENYSHVYHGHSPQVRTSETHEILTKALTGKGSLSELEDGPEAIEAGARPGQDPANVSLELRITDVDTIFLNALSGWAAPRVVEGLYERGCGSLEGTSLKIIREALMATGYKGTLFDFLLYRDTEDFGRVANHIGTDAPAQAESFMSTFERAYGVADYVLNLISSIEGHGDDSLILLTTHKVFGTFLINAILNSVKEKHVPEPYLNDAKYSPHFLTPYLLEPSHFARINICLVEEDNIWRPHAIVQEIGEHSHLAGIKTMGKAEQDRLIEHAYGLLKRTG